MLRAFLILVVAFSLSACAGRSESALPEAGTMVVKRDKSNERYQVTWSGVSTYDRGACEIRQPCVHLVRTVDTDNRVEVAVTLNEFSEQFRRLN